MPRIETELIGGPVDGRLIGLNRRPKFVWVDKRDGGDCYLTPKANRVLYRRLPKKGKNARSFYVYAGHTHLMCPGCGVYHETIEGHVTSCSLCGSAFAAT